MSIPWVELEKLALTELFLSKHMKCHRDVFELDAIKNKKCFKLKPVL